LAAPADIGARAVRAATAVSAARADANLFGLLGLLLLLLVFFIMLSSAARPDAERAQPVMQSLRSAFDRSFAPAGDPALTGGDRVGEPRIIAERLSGLLRSALPLADVAIAGDARRLFVDLPAGGFFRAEEARLSPLARERLRHVASIIDQATGGAAYSLALAAAPALPAARARLAALAAMLAGRPLGATALSAAIDAAAPADRIRLVLTLGAATGGRP
jgi:hypothetical protein